MSELLRQSRFLRALRREPVDRTPIWIMRQAGRYLPEYREVRKKAGDFLTLCKTPELACTVTLQPLQRFPLDAAILFSDILTIPDAMGLGLEFAEGEGPRFRRPLRTPADIDRISAPDVEGELAYVFEAARLVRGELDPGTPLIGFSGSPWTLATYMIEGAGSRDFRHSKQLLFNEPEALHSLLHTLSETVINYCRRQIEAGVQAIMLFDTWGGALADGDYQQVSLHHLARIVTALSASHDDVPVIVFTKGGGLWLEDIAATGCAGVGLDWTVNLESARRRVGRQVALQGNLDPGALHARPAVIRERVAALLRSFGTGSGHVFNLGHGIDQHVPPEHVAALVDAVHELSEPYHREGQAR